MLESLTVAMIVLLAFGWGLFRIVERWRRGPDHTRCGSHCDNCSASSSSGCAEREKASTLVSLHRKTEPLPRDPSDRKTPDTLG